MEDKVLEEVGKNLIGDYGWLVVAGFAALLLKNTVGNMVAGSMFMFGNDFNVDDIVYIGGKTKSRITRISLQKTTFHIIDTDRKLIIPNTSLYGLKCEKVLPQNGGPKKNLGLEAWKKDLEGMMIKKQKCCHPKSKSGYTKGDLYKDSSGKKILKG